jgi:hypothetical protein
VRATAPDTFTGAEYLRAVEVALNTLPAVVGVNLDAQDSFREKELNRPDPPISLEDDGAFPHLEFGTVEFELVIPERVQREVTPYWESPQSERFRVTIEQGWRLPITLVEPIEARGSAPPSDSVVIVREFLSRELERANDPFVEFQFLGPSPVHADIFLVPSETALGSERFNRILFERPGYALYRFEYDSGSFTTAEEAARAFHGQVLSELDLLYAVKQHNHVAGERWRELNQAVGGLIEAQRRGGLKAFVQRTFSPGRTSAVQIDLASFEMAHLGGKERLQKEAADEYGPGSGGLLEEVVSMEASDIWSFPVRQVGTVLDLLERRRLTDRDLLIVALSSVLGGLVGAVATLLAAG